MKAFVLFGIAGLLLSGCSCRPGNQKGQPSDKALPVSECVKASSSLASVPPADTQGKGRSHAVKDSLNFMYTEYDYYPVGTPDVSLFVTNTSDEVLEADGACTLDYYQEEQQVWETLPEITVIHQRPTIAPRYSGVWQSVSLEIPKKRRAGRYRIGQRFKNSPLKHYAVFELVDAKGVLELRKRVDDYWRKGAKNPTDTVARNISCTYTQDGDTIFVMLMNDSPRFREMFRRKVLNYSAVSHGRFTGPCQLTETTYADTLQIRMRTERRTYPVGRETVSVILTNGSDKALFFGEDYQVARKEGAHWTLLYANTSWKDIGLGLEPGGEYRFDALLYPVVNDNRPGIYKVVKEISFSGEKKKWLMSAEFEIR